MDYLVGRELRNSGETGIRKQRDEGGRRKLPALTGTLNENFHKGNEGSRN